MKIPDSYYSEHFVFLGILEKPKLCHSTLMNVSWHIDIFDFSCLAKDFTNVQKIYRRMYAIDKHRIQTPYFLLLVWCSPFLLPISLLTFFPGLTLWCFGPLSLHQKVASIQSFFNFHNPSGLGCYGLLGIIVGRSKALKRVCLKESISSISLFFFPFSPFKVINIDNIVIIHNGAQGFGSSKVRRCTLENKLH